MDHPIRFSDQLRPQIRALRKKRGLTQGELGQQLGVGQARIAEIERSPGTVSFDQMLKLLSLLGASLVLKGSLLSEVTAKPSSEATRKRVNTTDSRPRVAFSSKEPQEFNPGAGVIPASGRHHVIRPKKGSW